MSDSSKSIAWKSRPFRPKLTKRTKFSMKPFGRSSANVCCVKFMWIFSWLFICKIFISHDPHLFPFQSQKVISLWMDLFYDGWQHIKSGMPFFIEMCPTDLFHFLFSNIAFVIIESVTKSSLSLTYVDKIFAFWFLAWDFIDQIFWDTWNSVFSG